MLLTTRIRPWAKVDEASTWTVGSLLPRVGLCQETFVSTLVKVHEALAKLQQSLEKAWCLGCFDWISFEIGFHMGESDQMLQVYPTALFERFVGLARCMF